MLDISVTADNTHGWHQHHRHHQHHHQHHRYRRHHYIIITIVNMIEISVTPNYTHRWHQHQDKFFGREERVEQLQIYKYLWILPYATISTHMQQTKRPLQIYGDFNAPLKNTFHGG